MLIIDAKGVKPKFLQHLTPDYREKVKDYSVLHINDSQWFFISSNVLKPKDPQHINPNWVMAGVGLKPV
jgi:hypothetical protein